MTGESRAVELVAKGEVGVTFIGHSSFLLQLGGKKVLVDPVFATRLVVLRRQRRPGLVVREMPAIDVVLITHAHMDHLNLPSLRRVVRATRRCAGRGSGGGGAEGRGGFGFGLGICARCMDELVGGARGGRGCG